MKSLFAYNWQVREEWLNWCSQLPEDELLKVHIGGAGGILRTLFHIIDVEVSWIQAMAGGVVEDPEFEDYASLDKVIAFHHACRPVVAQFVEDWQSDREQHRIVPPWLREDDKSYTCGEVMRHIIAHEIHHIGQMSVWARELGLKPVSANFIGRGLN
ncbi:DinB family protein [Paenibacillus marinisediminis]